MPFSEDRSFRQADMEKTLLVGVGQTVGVNKSDGDTNESFGEVFFTVFSDCSFILLNNCSQHRIYNIFFD